MVTVLSWVPDVSLSTVVYRGEGSEGKDGMHKSSGMGRIDGPMYLEGATKSWRMESHSRTDSDGVR